MTDRLLHNYFIPQIFMRLYLLRHAEADDTFPDPQRRLTDQGRQTAARLGAFMRRTGCTDIQAVIHSPYRRAVETARLCVEALGTSPSLNVGPWLTPEDEIDEAVTLASNARSSLLIVGHNPHLSFLAARLLTSSDTGLALHLEKGSLVCLEPLPVTSPKSREHEYWALRWALPPGFYDFS